MTDPTRLKGAARVRYFQGHYNYLTGKHSIPLPRLEVDGEKGPKTEKAIRQLKLCFGVQAKNVNTTLDDGFMRHMRAPFTRSLYRAPGQWARGLAYRTKVRRAHSAALKATAAGTVGEKALRYAGKYVGKTETGNNVAPWLSPLDHRPVLPTDELNWMIPGNPYCGLGVIVSYWKGAGIWLPAGFVYTPNILRAAGKTYRPKYGHPYKLTRVAVADARPGDIDVYDWSPGSGADHTALRRTPMRGGQAGTREWNTSPTNAGSQSNGGGVWDRTRPQGLMLGSLRVERIA